MQGSCTGMQFLAVASWPELTEWSQDMGGAPTRSITVDTCDVTGSAKEARQL